MNLKKMLVSIISIFMLVVFVGLQGMSYAANETQETIHMGILPLMVNSEPYMGYSINKPGDNNAAKIWRIVKYVSSDGAQIDANYNNIYCVKAGVGFTNIDSSGTLQRRPYNVSYDMKKERTQIKAQNEILKGLVSGTITLEDETTINRYDAILATMDMMYLPGESAETEKTELLNKILDYAMQPDSGYTAYVGLIKKYPLTENDIVAVQQAALWYFTNNEEAKYDKTDDIGWLNYTLDGTDYEALSNYTPNNLQPQYDAGQARSYQAEILYNYIIKEAKANANKYTNSSSETIKPVKINTKTLAYTESEDKQNYIVGPISITENLSTIPYTINLDVKNNGEDVSYILLNSDKTEATVETVKELIGNNFYISIPKTEEISLEVNINVNYNNTIMTLWASTTNNQEQPLAVLEKKPETMSANLTLNINKEEPEKIFDLALRKYITKINGVELTELGLGTRVPRIDENTIKSNTTTATYKHRKDPITIVKGDKVTYKLTIYNEGEKAGRATKIVDQLPTGLKYTQILSGNFELDSYDETTNTLKLKRKANNTENLPAYTEGNLASETIEIVCEVTATPDSKVTKVLTNVAWISEEYDAEDNITIKDEENLDIDSEPGTIPNVDKDSMSNYTGKNNKTDLSDSDWYYKGEQDDDDFEKLVLLPEAFDLKLIKRITAVNDQAVPERIKSVDVSKLNTLDENENVITTGDYELNKEPVGVEKGDIVTYTFRIYNEGTINGYAQEITEDVPEGLEFLWSEKEGEELQADTTLTDEEKEAIEFNQEYLWGKFVYDEEKENIIQISSDYLSRENETTVGENLLNAFGKNDGTKTEADISYKEISVKFKVVSENVAGTIIRNEAAITEDCDENGETVNDRDSDTNDWKKYEDDEDYDNIILQSFDLALRKFIIAVSEDTQIENNEYLKNEDGSYIRAPKVDTSKLNTLDENGKLITTAIYNHTKEPITVRKNDIVVYMLRVYNEGDRDGYAAEIKDHLPEYLEFVDGEFNEQYGWQASEDGRTITTKFLENSKLEKTSTDREGNIVLSYKEVPIMCKVKDTAKTDEKITNIADITKYLDENKEPVIDRDSEENNVELPKDEELPKYKDDETGSYIPGQQDDDDFEKVIIKRFDLALRKFITAIDEKEVTTRIPQVKFEDGKIAYEHDKTPMQVVTNDVVTYTIRIFNEGEIAGYATEITDDIPEGLVFIPENELNQTMRWKMIDENGDETTEVEKAVKITTDYLSKEQEKEDGENLLNAFNSNADISVTNPDYKDVQVAFRVIEPNSSDKIIVNSAQISEDSDKNGNPIDDDDSIPNIWNEGEDDQDKEYIKLVEFDLALRKWVTQAIVIENGKETVTQTGHKPYDDPEEIVKVELHRKKLNQVTVKFRYSIRVINEGEIEGYAKEVTDYVPEGLKFVAADNPGWTDEGNNVISTNLLENTLLKPGEYADVEIVLTWINSQDNMGVMENVAEISEDYNEYDVADKDSTPDNKKDGEDDIDDAPVMLSISTGQIRIYFTLGFIILATIAGGIILIKKFVL